MAINVLYFVENIPFSEKKRKHLPSSAGYPQPTPGNDDSFKREEKNSQVCSKKKMDFRFRHLCFFSFLTFSAINIPGEHHYIAFFAQIRR